MGNRFDQAAATWDQEDRRLKLAQDVAQAIRTHVPLEDTPTALDFGCGTGLVSFELLREVKHLVGADSSEGMVAEFRKKAWRLSHSTTSLLIQDDSPLGGPYHLIFSSMALHHLMDVPATLARLHGALRSGGWIALADLESEDGSFHGDAAGVFHHGFDRNALATWLREAGFQGVSLHAAATTVKDGRTYSIFLAAAQKP